MKSDTLGLTWLNGRLDAAWVDRRGKAHAWTSPQPVHDAGSLALALTAAARQQGMTARRACFVLDHRHLIFHVQETPPAKGPLLDQILDRAMTENRFYDEPAAYTRVALPSPSHRQRWLLAICPKALLREIEVACENNRLELVGLFPAATLLASFLPKPATAPDSVQGLLLVADLGASHGLLAGTTDGQVLFARSIAPSLDPSPVRLQQEINRTLHFCQQQFGVGIQQIIALGSYCHAVLSGQPPRDDVKVEALGTNLLATDFARLAVELTPKAPFNFYAASRKQQQVDRGRNLVALGILGLFAGSLALAASTAVGTSLRQQEIAESRRRAEAEQSAATVRADQQREGYRLLELIETIPSPDSPVIATQFAKYLQYHVPTNARLTALDLTRGTNGWTVQIEGTTTEQGARFVQLVEDFETQLREGIFQLKVQESTARQLRGGTPLGPPRPTTAAAILALSPSESPTAAGDQPFYISGRIQ